jgi:hypothetical protein
MAQVVSTLGRGGQRFSESVLGWNRGTVRKGQQEVLSGEIQNDRSGFCGRPLAEAQLPHLLQDIKSIVEPTGQTDPTFRSTRVYTPLSSIQVCERLRSLFGYRGSKLPSTHTIRTKLNDLGYCLTNVNKCKPIKKIPETDLKA